MSTASIRRRTWVSRITIAGLCLVLSLAALGADSSGTTVTFPRFFADNRIGSGVAVFNPSTREASVTFTLREFDGTQTGSVLNPVTVRVPALGQITRTATELFGRGFSRLDGSLEATSTTPGLVFFSQTFDFNSTFTDGAEPPQASMELIFPVVPSTADGDSEHDLQNPNTRSTAVDLRLYSFDGELLGTGTVSLPPGGFYADFAAQFFPSGTKFDRASHITATARASNVFTEAQTISGTSLIGGFSAVSASGSYQDVAALNALALTQTSNAGALPLFRSGAKHASTLALVNAEPASIDVNLTAIGNSGSTLGTRRVTLQGHGGYRAPIESVFAGLGTAEREGWILVSANGRVAASILFGRRGDGAFAALPMQLRSEFQFVFPQIVQGSGMSTELSLANSGSRTATADVFVVTPGGVTLSNSSITIPPSSRISDRIDSLLPEISGQVGGLVFVRSTEPLYGALAISTDDGSTVSSFTPATVPSSYEPAVQKSFALTGKVTLNGIAVEGFSVSLSGAASKTTTTRSDGTFAFTGLAAGKYSLSVAQLGIDFSPSLASIEITTRSARQDFVAVTSPDSVIVSPPTARVGASDTTLTIFGSGFSASSVAFLEDTRLDTTFVDRTQLRAVVPSFLLAKPAILDLTVVTDGRATQPFAFAASQDKPTLSSVTTAANIVEGSQGSTVTLRGTGFLEGAKVKVNGTSDGVVISAIDDTRILAFLPSSFFVKAGIFPVTVSNPIPADAESEIRFLTVYHPAPAIEETLPKSVSVRLAPGLGALDLEVLGNGFRRGAVVNFDGVPLVTTYCEQSAYCLSVHLYARVPASFLTKSGFYEITVDNPSPSLSGSTLGLLRVEGLQPTITNVLAGAATVLDLTGGYTLPVIVDGTNFGPQTLVTASATGGSSTGFRAPDEILSMHQLAFTIPDIKYSASPVEWSVEVMNPQPGGGKSLPVKFTISPGNFVQNPFLISMTPQTVAAGGASFTLTVNGTNFINGAQIHFNAAPLVTTVVSATQVRAQIPASLIGSAGRYPVTVLNPDNGGVSNKLYIDVR